jgi:hypothetical protein
MLNVAHDKNHPNILQICGLSDSPHWAALVPPKSRCNLLLRRHIALSFIRCESPLPGGGHVFHSGSLQGVSAQNNKRSCDKTHVDITSPPLPDPSDVSNNHCHNDFHAGVVVTPFVPSRCRLPCPMAWHLEHFLHLGYEPF